MIIGSSISHYRLLQKLDEGGIGVVYKAEDTSLGRFVALKVLTSQLISDQDARRRFIREAKAAASLDHPGICTIYEAGDVDGQLFIAMALLQGETLRQRIAAGRLTTQDAVDIATQVASALAAAHAREIIHRDIKPENIMLTSEGQAKVLDFGLARIADTPQITRTGVMMGTVAYMSPEQLQGETVDARTDLWSLGVVLYEMLSGEHPFQAAYEPALRYEILNPDAEPLSDIPPGLWQVVVRCLKKKATERYARAEDVIADLKRFPRSEMSDTKASRTTPISAVQILSDRYRIERMLGRGGMGEVWLAFDLKLGVEVALKFLLPELLSDLERVALLRREVRSARNVSSPHVCRVFDLVEIDGQEVVSMEYVDGQTLQDLIELEAPLELDEARRIAQQLLVGLQAIHDAGLIHRDLKPSNVMITRTGRTVVMDFGVAKGTADTQSLAFAGTPVYMAPEQRSGDPLGPWTDLFAVGVILAEMVAPAAVEPGALRFDLWEGLRHEPPRVPAGPWEPVIRRAVASRPRERFSSAAELARALGDSEVRIGILDDVTPYPGLSVFTEADSPFFFGRELDVEMVWRKINRLSLSALIGPSGVGKSSFLRAGVLASRPDGWNIAITTPGNNPFNSLGQSLLSEFASQGDAHDLFRLNEIDRSIPLLNKWRLRSKQALLIVDQFEELFTLNPPEVQARFAELLGRLSVEADIHVLVSMRDDFFFLSQQYPSLRPLFTEPTPLGPLSAQALRRPIVEPARLCGFTFEDDALVDEIMKDVEGERGALPLVAFAAAQLWDLRDRDHGVITRRSYEEIGRVGGALAQHAEATLEKIGTEREDIVREIFRNLATAQHTRVVRERDELLSVFLERATAEQVLNALIDARLLTSFEITEGRKGSTERHRIEVVHESLLTNWPRLVRWQTQDTEGAQMHDQLRQAAQLWKERNKSDDLLWTGTVYKEFELWRERYPGGLTATEEAFASAMVGKAGRQRRRRRQIIVGTFAALMLVTVGVTALWVRAQVSQRRSEASKLLALGRTELEANPSAALAYAVASLELADSPTARQFAIEALSRGPSAVLVNNSAYGRPVILDFSPDGNRLAVGGSFGVCIYSRDGAPPVVLSSAFAISVAMQKPQFAPDGDRVVFTSNDDPTVVRIWSLSEGREIRKFPMEGVTLPLVRGNRLFLITDLAGPEGGIGLVAYPATANERTGTWTRTLVRSWAFDAAEPTLLGRWDPNGITGFDIDSQGRWLAYPKGRGVYLLPLDELSSDRERLVGEHAGEAGRVRFDAAGERLASSDMSGEIRLWSLAGGATGPLRVMAGKDPLCGLWFSPSGEMLAAAYASPDKDVRLWDLTGPRDADPVVFRRGMASLLPAVAFDPSGQWIAVSYHMDIALWSLGQPRPFALRGGGAFGSRVVAFSPDGESLVAAFYQGGIRIWSLNGGPTRDLWKPQSDLECIAIDPRGRFVAAGTVDDGVYLVSLADGRAQRLAGGPPGMWTGFLALSSDGRWVAGAVAEGATFRIRVWDLEAGTSQALQHSEYCLSVATADRRVFSSSFGSGELRQWDLFDGNSTVLARGHPGTWTVVPTGDGRALFAATLVDTTVSVGNMTLELLRHDLDSRTSRTITSHGNRVAGIAVDSAGTRLATIDLNGVARIGSTTGEEPHLFMAPERLTSGAVNISPDGRWVAAADNSSPIVYLWRVPEGPPLQLLPHEEFLERLRAHTYARVVADPASAAGYRVDDAPYSGWETVPTW